MAKKVLYKLYKDNQYLMTLPQNIVVSPFNYTQDLQTAYVPLDITLALTLEQAGLSYDTDYLVDESGNHLLDENGNRLALRQDLKFSSYPINSGYRIVATVFDDTYNVNGTVKFDGFIEYWESDDSENTITLHCLSWGRDLDEHLYFGFSGVAYDGDTNSNGELQIFSPSISPAGRITKIAQTFQNTTGADYGLVWVLGLWRKSGISSPNQFVKVSVVEGTPAAPGSVLASIEQVITNYTTSLLTSKKVYFSKSVTIKRNTTYHLLFEHAGYDSSEPIYFATNTPGAYANGVLNTYTDSTGWASTANDLCFYWGGGSIITNISITNVDPATALRQALLTYQYNGGRIVYDSTSIDNVSYNVSSYKFRANTTYECIQKALELAPSNYYWYVDIATNTLHFHARGTTANHTIVRGKHVRSLRLKYTMQYVKNAAILSAGDTGSGSNLVLFDASYGNIASLGQQRLARLSDSRINNTVDGALLLQGAIGDNPQPIFETTVTVNSANYDIDSYTPGQMVGFANFNDVYNSLLLQIVSLQRIDLDNVLLRLASLPVTTPYAVDKLRRDLMVLQTVDNSETPL